MNRLRSLGIVVAGSAVLAVGGTLALDGRADAAKVTVPATFAMYANVDAEGDLGSNVGAVSVTKPYDDYADVIVNFKKPIGSCAGTVQVGKAGGPDVPDKYVWSTVTYAGTSSFDVSFFALDNGNGQTYSAAEPFMLLVTCRK